MGAAPAGVTLSARQQPSESLCRRWVGSSVNIDVLLERSLVIGECGVLGDSLACSLWIAEQVPPNPDGYDPRSLAKRTTVPTCID